jgi:hypothetical protein
MVSKNFKIISIVFCIIFISGFSYIKSISKASSYAKACSRLGFAKISEQQAVYNILRIAGYLETKALRAAIYRSEIFSDPEAVFRQLSDPEKFYKSNFCKTDDFAQLLLYITQTAFDRTFGQERLELHKKPWMDEYKTDYFKYASKLGLTKEILPNFEIRYDASLVLGASRPGLYARLTEMNFYLKQGLKTDMIFVLAGERELWAEIDGFSPLVLEKFQEAISLGISVDQIIFEDSLNIASDKIEEGKGYIRSLADRLNIIYDTQKPFEIRNNRFYLRVLDGAKPTEATMAQDLMKEFPLIALKVLDTKAYQNGERPDTVSTARHFAEQFVQSIINEQRPKSVYNILAVSNNPYATRQAIAVQRECDNALKIAQLNNIKITVHGVGFKAQEENIAVIHSELGALFSELFKNAYPEVNTEKLMFRTRKNDVIIPEIVL